MSESEVLWINQAQAGDDEAFAELVEAYQRPVYNLCNRMLSNSQDAEDASQETFLRAFKAIGKYDRQRPFATWLLSIAAHYCIDQIRRRRLFQISLEDLPVPDLPDGEIDVETRLSRKADQTRIRRLLQVLEPTDRAVVVFYYWYELSLKEIGTTLDLTESAVKSRLHRARKMMAQRWLELEPAPQYIAEGMAV